MGTATASGAGAPRPCAAGGSRTDRIWCAGGRGSSRERLGMGRLLSARETSAHGAKSPRKNGGGETAKIIARESKKTPRRRTPVLSHSLTSDQRPTLPSSCHTHRSTVDAFVAIVT